MVCRQTFSTHSEAKVTRSLTHNLLFRRIFTVSVNGWSNSAALRQQLTVGYGKEEVLLDKPVQPGGIHDLFYNTSLQVTSPGLSSLHLKAVVFAHLYSFISTVVLY